MLTQKIPLMIKVDILYGFRMTLECAFQLACFPVPDLDSCIIARRRNDRILRVERNTCYWRPVPSQDMCSWCSWNPVSLRSSAFCWCEGELFLKRRVSVFKVHDLVGSQLLITIHAKGEKHTPSSANESRSSISSREVLQT